MFSISNCILWLLFMFAVDLFDLSGSIISVCLCIFFLFYLKKIKMDHSSLLLMVFSASYFLSVFFYEGVSFDEVIKYGICPWACYLLAYNVIRYKSGCTVTKFTEVVFIGFFIHGFLNLTASISQYGIDFNNPFRLAYDFWQNHPISVTTASLYYSPMVLMAIGMLFSTCNRVRKILAIFVIGVGVFATILYQNRTLVLASVIVIVMAVCFLLLDKNISKKRKHIIIVCLAGAGIFLSIIWLANIGGIRDFLESTSFYARISGATGENQNRTKIWASFILGGMWKYPLGHSQIALSGNSQFVHNTWLDIYRRAGLIPFISFSVFTFFSIKTVIRFWEYCKKNLFKEENYEILTTALIGVASIFFVEPVMEANPYLFYLPIMIIGTMNGRMSCEGGM